MTRNTKHYAYVFTVNNWTDDDIACIMSMEEDPSVTYYIVGFEVGEQGTPHLQGYVHFSSKIYFNSMSKKIPRARIDPAKGTPQQNYDYCSKDGDFYQYGQLPCQGRANKQLIESVMKDPYSNFHLYNQYRKAYRELQYREKKQHERRIYLLDYAERFHIMDECTSCIYIPTDKYDLYTDEQVVILEYDATCRDEVVRWVHGHPPSIRRGFELIKFDPEIIFLLYSSAHEYAHLRKIYYKLISD